MSRKKTKQEIVSLNEALLVFDGDDISLEVLERRLELFVCAVFKCVQYGSCENFTCGQFT